MLLLLCRVRRQIVTFRHAYLIDLDVLAVARVVLGPPLVTLVDRWPKSFFARVSAWYIDIEVKVPPDRSRVPDGRTKAQVAHPAAIFRKALEVLLEKFETLYQVNHLLNGKGARVIGVSLECQHELHAEFTFVTVEVARRLEDVPGVVGKVENNIPANLHGAEDAGGFKILHRRHHIVEGGFVAASSESNFLLQIEGQSVYVRPVKSFMDGLDFGIFGHGASPTHVSILPVSICRYNTVVKVKNKPVKSF